MTATPSTAEQLTAFLETGLSFGESPDATWGDFDGDGDLDVFVCCSRLYRNDGRWEFTKVEAGIRDFPAVVGDDVAGSADWGDFDGDGDLDLVIAGYETKTSGTVEIYRNEGDSDSDGTVEFVQVEAGLSDFSGGGNFDYIVQAPPLGGMKRPSSQWGDYDSDGDLDLVVTGSRTATIYRNGGEGTFTDINAGLQGVDWGTSQWGDYDSDGDLDLVITGSPEGRSSRTTVVYRNEGNGKFTPSGDDISGVTAGFSEWGDYDDDGDLDLVIGGGIKGETIYENQDGSFIRESPGTYGFSFPARWTGSATWVDYDQDGDLDLFVSGYKRDVDDTFQDGSKQDILTLYKNKGNGQFEYLTHIKSGTPPRSSSEWGDYDADGDPDLLLAGDQTEILQNGIPESVDINVQRSFADASGPEDYRLVALPGAVDRPLGSAVRGEFGASWKAYWDDGSSIVEFDGSDQFHFRPGRGFWLTSTSQWTVRDSVKSMLSSRANEDAITVPLHAGWNIISNPLGLPRAWSDVASATGADLQPLWSFNGSYQQVDTMRSAKTGQAYYFYNDQNLSSLKIPGPNTPTESPVAKDESPRSAERQRFTEALSLTARAEGSDSSEASRIRIGIDESAESDEETSDVFAPPGRFEDVSLRLHAPYRPDSVRTRYLMTDLRPPFAESAEKGRTFNLTLFSEIDKPITLRPIISDEADLKAVTLIHSGKGETYDLQAREQVTLDPKAEKIRLRLAAGTEEYVAQEREQALPDRIMLTSYPNPFSKRATLEYTLPEAKDVRLAVYDVLGRRVALLENERKKAGRHQVYLEGASLSSGVYFGRLRVGDQTRTQKITVVR